MLDLKKQTRNFLRRRGFEIRKFPRVDFRPAPVFDICVELLMAQRGKQITFIQVGANDGSYVDPIRQYILKYPWHGVLVEPQESAFRALLKNYASVADRLMFENLAISHNSNLVMYRAPGSFSGNATYAASVVSSNPGAVARQLNLKTEQLEHFLVPCATLDSLIKKHSLQKLDLLQIDAEGYDWHVLSTLTLANVRPSIIQFEHGHLSTNAVDQVASFLDANDYMVYWGGHQGDSVALSDEFIKL